MLIVINITFSKCWIWERQPRAKSTLSQDEKPKKDMKKRKNKDDTEQPIYPCEECTQCFTTLSDLKVCISYLTCHSLISFIYRCIQEHIQKLHVIYVRFVIKVLLVQVLCVDTWRWVKPFCFISILYLKDKKGTI